MNQGLIRAATSLCRELRKLQAYGEPGVEFYWDNGMSAFFQVTKVPTFKISSGGVTLICDHEGERHA